MTMLPDTPGLVELSSAWFVFEDLAKLSAVRRQKTDLQLSKKFGDNIGIQESIHILCKYGLRHVLPGHLSEKLKNYFVEQYMPQFWERFTTLGDVQSKWDASVVEVCLTQALREISAVIEAQENCFSVLEAALTIANPIPGISTNRGTGPFPTRSNWSTPTSSVDEAGGQKGEELREGLIAEYCQSISAQILNSAPPHFSDLLLFYFRSRLKEFSKAVRRQRYRHEASDANSEDGHEEDGSDEDGSEDEEEGDPDVDSRGSKEDNAEVILTDKKDELQDECLEEVDEDLMQVVEEGKTEMEDTYAMDQYHSDSADDGASLDLSITGEAVVAQTPDLRMGSRTWPRRSETQHIAKSGGDEGPSFNFTEEMNEQFWRSGRSGDGEPEWADAHGETVDMEEVKYGGRGPMLKEIRDPHGPTGVMGREWAEHLAAISRMLRFVGLAPLSEEAYTSVIYSELRAKVMKLCKGQYEREALPTVRQWIQAVPLRFLTVLLPPSPRKSLTGWPSRTPLTMNTGVSTWREERSFPSPLASPAPSFPGVDRAMAERVERWRLRLEFFAHQVLRELRTSELFDVIVDYPESLPALIDLRHCLQNTGHQSRLVSSFRNALEKRLLTSGAATSDILSHYVSTVKSLRALDPTGVLLDAVGDPIKEYLRGRRDTVRCIVTLLTDDSSVNTLGIGVTQDGEGGEEELQPGPGGDFDESDEEGDGVLEVGLVAAERWEPDPVDSDPMRRMRRGQDMVRLLVGIAGTKEPLMAEHRVMLADRLITKTDYDTDKEIRTLELLKLRFGESSLQNCEVMLKDISDSKRVNANIKRLAMKAPVSEGLVTPLSPSPTPSPSPSTTSPSFTPISNFQVKYTPPSSVESGQFIPSSTAPAVASNQTSHDLTPSQEFPTHDTMFGGFVSEGMVTFPDFGGDAPLPPDEANRGSTGTSYSDHEIPGVYFPLGQQLGVGGRGGGDSVGEGRGSSDMAPDSRTGQTTWRQRMQPLRLGAKGPNMGPSLSQIPGSGNRGNSSNWQSSVDQEATLEVFNATIVSTLFWPPFQEEAVNLPPAVERLMEVYGQHYNSLKSPRKLRWLRNLGSVKLELQFEDRSAQFVVTPVQAAAISLFEQRPRWTNGELAIALGVPGGTVRRRVSVWVNQGVLSEAQLLPGGTEMVYTVAERLGQVGDSGNPSTSASGDTVAMEEEGESVIASVEAQKEQEWAVHESFVMGMLTTFGDGLPLERIHNMLKMFVADPPYDKTIQQLQAFLNGLMTEEKLDFREGVYKKRR